jgi:hypothetical protein
MKTKEQIEHKLAILKGALESKLWVLNDPNYISTLTEIQIAKERIEEMETAIPILEWVLDI